MTGLSVPGFLVDNAGDLIFFNDAAGVLLGQRFEEAGRMTPDEWGTRFGPLDAGGSAMEVEELPLTIALRQGRPAQSRFHIRSLDGGSHEINVTAIPIVTTEGTSGAMAFFWALDGGEG
jgi:PAS domain-containing protein